MWIKAALAPVFSQRHDNTRDERDGNYIWSRKCLIKPMKHAGEAKQAGGEHINGGAILARHRLIADCISGGMTARGLQGVLMKLTRVPVV